MKTFFGKLKSFETILRTQSWQDFTFLDYNDKYDLTRQLKDKLDFICENENHWIEIEKETNDYLYWKNKDIVIIISEEWLSERRD